MIAVDAMPVLLAVAERLGATRGRSTASAPTAAVRAGAIACRRAVLLRR
jgi:hypothetical protein